MGNGGVSDFHNSSDSGIHFGNAGSGLPEPLPEKDDIDPDDEQLAETPKDVVMMLGFDPATIEGFDDEATDAE
jgi:hypothetical protein